MARHASRTQPTPGVVRSANTLLSLLNSMLPQYFLHVLMSIGFGAAVSLQELDHRLVLGAKEMTSKKTAPGDVFFFLLFSFFLFLTVATFFVWVLSFSLSLSLSLSVSLSLSLSYCFYIFIFFLLSQPLFHLPFCCFKIVATENFHVSN